MSEKQNHEVGVGSTNVKMANVNKDDLGKKSRIRNDGDEKGTLEERITLKWTLSKRETKQTIPVVGKRRLDRTKHNGGEREARWVSEPFAGSDVDRKFLPYLPGGAGAGHVSSRPPIVRIDDTWLVRARNLKWVKRDKLHHHF